jgi:hypothetical protein
MQCEFVRDGEVIARPQVRAKAGVRTELDLGKRVYVSLAPTRLGPRQVRVDVDTVVERISGTGSVILQDGQVSATTVGSGRTRLEVRLWLLK